MIKKVPVEISARHIHLSQTDLEALFGKNYQLRKLKNLTQSSDFAAKETVDIQFGSRKIEKVRIIGPTREKTQVELSKTDAIKLGINPPIKSSGSTKGTPGITLIGPKKKIRIKEGVIIPWRHIHCTAEEADFLGVRKGQMVSVKVKGERAVTFHNVKIRVNKNYSLCLHLDTDEGNAAGINKKGWGVIL